VGFCHIARVMAAAAEYVRESCFTLDTATPEVFEGIKDFTIHINGRAGSCGEHDATEVLAP
jgi:hypothetical protein